MVLNAQSRNLLGRIFLAAKLSARVGCTMQQIGDFYLPFDDRVVLVRCEGFCGKCLLPKENCEQPRKLQAVQ